MWALHDRLDDLPDAPATRELIESIRQHGQRQPALGRPLRSARSDGIEVELIYGARRLAAARVLCTDLIVELRDLDDRAALVEMDIENRVREDISAYERGHSLRNALSAGLFASQSDLAKALGMSEAQVSRLLRFADLPAVLVSAFQSYRDIKEDWAGVLAKLWKLPEYRKGIERRARKLSGMPCKPAADDIYNQLISDGRSVLPRTRVKDEVIRSGDGRPLFRIGIRARAIHLILPRVLVTGNALKRISDDMRANLEASKQTTGDEQ